MALSLEGLGFCAKVFACNPKGRGPLRASSGIHEIRFES